MTREKLHTLPLGDDGVGQVLVELDIMARLHGELTAALCPRTEVGCVAEHLGQRDEAVDLLCAAALCQAGDRAAAGGTSHTYSTINFSISFIGVKVTAFLNRLKNF